MKQKLFQNASSFFFIKYKQKFCNKLNSKKKRYKFEKLIRNFNSPIPYESTEKRFRVQSLLSSHGIETLLGKLHHFPKMDADIAKVKQRNPQY